MAKRAVLNMQLLNYDVYKQHEVKAFWEYLQLTGRRVSVVGKKGPLRADLPAVAVDSTIGQY